MINRVAVAAAVAAGRWRWRKARSLTDLANLQADRIARKMDELADDDLGPRRSMYLALIALGRTGVVVADWRPGTFAHISDPSTTLESRACVTGFADDETKDWLDDLLYFAGKEPGAAKYKLASVIELYAPGCLEYDRFDGDDSGRFRGHAVGRIDGAVTEHIGSSMTAREVFRAFPTRRSVQQQLRKAWLITICAPAWGDNRMFDDLPPLLRGSHPATV